MFKHYISLGENCEVAFQFRRVLGRDQASFFSWNVSSFEAIIALLADRFSGILRSENFAPHWDGSLINDTKYNYLFHSMFPRGEIADYTIYPDIIERHRTKAAHLVHKLYQQCSSADSIVFFHKTSRIEAKFKAELLNAQLLALMPDGKLYRLVIVLPDSMAENDWGHPVIANRYLRRFAPDFDATDGHVAGWDRIFADFPHVDGLQLAGY